MKKRFFFSLTPVLLVVVAVIQWLLSHWLFLSPWKGGGFGMFSAISLRAVACTITSSDGQRSPCELAFRGKGKLGPLTTTRLRALKTFPTQGRLESILDDYQKMGVVNLVFQETRDASGERTQKVVSQNSAVSMELEVYQMAFDQKALRATMVSTGIKAYRAFTPQVKKNE